MYIYVVWETRQKVDRNMSLSCLFLRGKDQKSFGKMLFQGLCNCMYCVKYSLCAMNFSGACILHQHIVDKSVCGHDLGNERACCGWKNTCVQLCNSQTYLLFLVQLAELSSVFDPFYSCTDLQCTTG